MSGPDVTESAGPILGEPTCDAGNAADTIPAATAPKQSTQTDQLTAVNSPKTEKSALQRALAYANQGWYVFPCGDDKRPLVKWSKVYTNDPEKVRELWAKYPGAQVGLPTGATNGFVAVDIDVKNGIDGFASVKAEGLELPGTFTQTTRSGGRHYWFSDPEGEIGSRNAFLKGVDIKGEGGYVIAYASRPSEGFPDAPKWLFDRIPDRSRRQTPAATPVAPPAPFKAEIGGEINDRQRAYLQAEMDRERQNVRRAEQGTRNNTLNKAAYSLGGFVGTQHLSPSDVEQALLSANAENSRPLPSREAQGAIASGLKDGAAKPRAVPEVPIPNVFSFDTAAMRKNAEQRRIDQASAAATNDLPIVNPADWGDELPPKRPWLVHDLIPSRQVTLLSGDGGVGKSLLALQLGVSVAMGWDWIGMGPSKGGVVYLGAEDEEDEFHRRLSDIVRAQGERLSNLEDFRLIPLAGKDAVLGEPPKGSNRIQMTPKFAALSGIADDLHPSLIVLDTSADLFAGSEIDRAQVRQFIGHLRGLAIDQNLAVVLLSHPSLTGLNSGTGTSGSTAWNNSVRSRLYVEREKVDGEETGATLMRIMKANYAERGGQTRLRWHEGVFVVDDGTPAAAQGIVNKKVDELFLSIFTKLTRQGRDLSPSPSATYAPKVIAEQPEAVGTSKKNFAAAMQRLLDEGLLAIVKEGPPSRERRRLRLASEIVQLTSGRSED